MNKKYLLFICISLINIAPLLHSSTWELYGQILDITGTNNDEAVNDKISINYDGDILAFAQPEWPDINNPKGRVIIYQFGADKKWSINAQIVGENDNDSAGSSVSITDGFTITEGEIGWSGGIGRVRAFDLNITDGSLIPKGNPLDMTGATIGGQFGASVSSNFDSSNIAVGEPYWSGGIGLVKVFNFDGTSWVPMGNPSDMVGTTTDDLFGSSVAISSDGTIVAIGAPGRNGAIGKTLVYEFSGSSWVAVGGPNDMAGETGNDQAGYSVAISADGTIVAMGEPSLYGLNNQVGRVRVFKFNSFLNKWEIVGEPNDLIADSISTDFGISVDLNGSGQIVTIGEPFWKTDSNSPDYLRGRMHIYKYDSKNNRWNILGNVINGLSIANNAGYAVTINLDGDIVAMSEISSIFSKGNIRAFQLEYNQIKPFLSSKPQNLGGTVNAAGPREDFINTIYNPGFGDLIRLP